MIDTATIIREARQLITPPEAWTQHANARVVSGEEVGALYEGASCFCAIGALQKIAPAEFTRRRAVTIIRRLAGGSVSHFNDTHTHEEVLALLDKAALAAEDVA